MDVETLFKQMDEKTKKALDHTAHEFASVNTGKANPSLVEGVVVEVYGSKMPLRDVAAITTPDARTIAVLPWDKSTLRAIEKALQMANLGINPSVMGDVVRLPLPDLTGERRQELVKFVAKHAEEGRVAARNARREAMDALKKLQKDGDVSEDDVKRHEKDIQARTDATIKRINDMLAAKEKDLTTV